MCFSIYESSALPLSYSGKEVLKGFSSTARALCHRRSPRRKFGKLQLARVRRGQPEVFSSPVTTHHGGAGLQVFA
jgi:hypothetical protein